MKHELYLKHRPQDFDKVLGQESAVKTIRSMLGAGEVPRAIIFTGPSGVGKTTIARILADKLECQREFNFMEVDCGATEEPINTARKVSEFCFGQPWGGRGHVRVCILDEVQSWSRAKFAQQALLKVLEDMPDWAYVFLCTTEPGKVIPTVLTRCTEVKLSAIKSDELEQVVMDVARAEGIRLSEEVTELLLEVADGSARRALVTLGKIRRLKTEEERLEAITRSDSRAQSIELCRKLMGGASWGEVAKLLKELDDDPEVVRRIILGYARSVMLGGGKQGPRAYMLFDAMRYNLFDTGACGLAGACWEFINGRG